MIETFFWRHIKIHDETQHLSNQDSGLTLEVNKSTSLYINEDTNKYLSWRLTDGGDVGWRIGAGAQLTLRRRC